jgi:hypothetical protein
LEPVTEDVLNKLKFEYPVPLSIIFAISSCNISHSNQLNAKLWLKPVTKDLLSLNRQAKLVLKVVQLRNNMHRIMILLHEV